MHIRRMLLHKIGIFSIFMLGLGAVLWTAHLFAANTSNISDVTITPQYRQTSIAWNYSSADTTSTNVFAVYRSEGSAGNTPHRIALVDSATRSFIDVNTIPSKTYSYAVVFCSSRDDLASLEPANFAWTAVQASPAVGQVISQPAIPTPHRGGATSDSANKTCKNCHVVHDAAGVTSKLLVTSQNSVEPNARIAICLTCHKKTGVPEAPAIQAALSSNLGHTINNRENAEGTLECLTCHGVHQDSLSALGALTPTYFYKYGTLTDNISVDISVPNAQCIPCHDDDQTWYGATHTTAYPSAASLESTQSVASGLKTYPTSGTYPGSGQTSDVLKNAHAKISAQETYSKGDCRYCHSSHGNGVEDMLLTSRGELRAMRSVGGVVSDEEKLSGDYASFCLSCHNGSNEGTPWAAAANIADSVSLPAGSTEESKTAFLLQPMGHRVSSQNADVPAGSALPCYTCHNPHGSTSNGYNLNDELGSNLTGDRNTCFACHTTSDGYILSADGSTYGTISASAPSVIGLSRTGTDTVSGEEVANKLRLPGAIEAHTKDSTMDCSGCHGTVHALHKPEGTGDSDGKSCLQCHTTEFTAALPYEFTAEGTPEAIGWEDGYNPHLIPAFSQSMGETFVPENILNPLPQPVIPTIAPLPGALQTTPLNAGSSSTSKVGPYCAGCHAWHSAEVAGGSTGATPGRDSGATLRMNYNSTEVANTDYVHNPSNPKLGGLCLSCHNDYLGSASVGAPTKGPLNDLNRLDSELFNNCFHNYTITVTRNANAGPEESTYVKTYNANCAKCHNDADAIASPYENRNTLDLKVHYVPGRRLLARFGIVADIAERATGSTDQETNMLNYNNRGMCFGCHARQGEIAGNAGKAYEGKDWYGQQAMNTPPSAVLEAEGWTYDAVTGLAKKVFKNTNNQVIGTITMNNEATFDDMYKLSTQPSGFPSGDGEKGAADNAAKSALSKGVGMEISGHQVNRPKAEWETSRLKPYVNSHMSAIRCSECHNVHATGMGAMGSHVEWPLTKKGRVGKTESAAVGGAVGMQGFGGNTIYTDNTTPDLAIATDGSRLITLNDFWSRNNITDDVHSAMVAWLQTPAGGGYSATDAQAEYDKLDFNGITPDQVAVATGTTVNQGLALEWSRTVDIFCFRCHSETAMAGKAHQGSLNAGSHKEGALACVDCHVPTVHGGKVPRLLTDRGAIADLDGGVATGHTQMQEHQIFRWVEYQKGAARRVVVTTPQIIGQPNTPKAMLYSVDSYATDNHDYTDRRSCAVNSACHVQGIRSESSGATLSGQWQNWTGAD